MFSVKLAGSDNDNKEIQEKSQAFIDEFNELIRELSNDPSMTIGEMEHQIIEYTQSLKQKLLELHHLNLALDKETEHL